MCLAAQLFAGVAFGSSWVLVCPPLSPGSLLAVCVYSCSLSVYLGLAPFFSFALISVCPVGFSTTCLSLSLLPPPPSVPFLLSLWLAAPDPASFCLHLCVWVAPRTTQCCQTGVPGWLSVWTTLPLPSHVVPSSHGSEPRGTGTRSGRIASRAGFLWICKVHGLASACAQNGHQIVSMSC